MLRGILWIVLALAILSVAAGAVTVGSGRIVLPWLAGRVGWRRWGWAMVALGLFMALESVPRLAEASAGLVLVLSTVALLPLAISLILQVRAQLPRG